MIHAALLETVHAHSRATPMASVPLPPPDSNEEVELVTEGWHRLVGPVGLDTLVVAELPQAADQTHAVSIDAAARVETRLRTSPADAQPSPELGSKLAVAAALKIWIIALVRKSVHHRRTLAFPLSGTAAPVRLKADTRETFTRPPVRRHDP